MQRAVTQQTKNYRPLPLRNRVRSTKFRTDDRSDALSVAGMEARTLSVRSSWAQRSKPEDGTEDPRSTLQSVLTDSIFTSLVPVKTAERSMSWPTPKRAVAYNGVLKGTPWAPQDRLRGRVGEVRSLSEWG